MITKSQIKNIRVHTNADTLELADVDGTQVVIPKGVYKEEDTVFFIEPDSVLPDQKWADEYRKYAPNRVKAIKLRGEYSNGIVIPEQELYSIVQEKFQEDANNGVETLIIQEDIDNSTQVFSDYMGLTHYVLLDKTRGIGNLPYNIPSTGATRIEKIGSEIEGEIDITLKIDGKSCSYYYNYEEKKFGILSRNMQIKVRDDNGKYLNTEWHQPLKEFGIENKLIEFCEKLHLSLCIRGELFGLGINNFKINPVVNVPVSWAMYSSWNITEEYYYTKKHPFYFHDLALALNLPHVPIIKDTVWSVLQQKAFKNEAFLLKYDFFRSNLKSEIHNKLVNGAFEGIVINHIFKGQHQLVKVINNYYDSKK